MVRYRRKMVWKNLRNSFPDKNDAELRRIEKDFYRNLCDYALEMLKLLTIRRDDLAKRMVFNNTSLIDQYKVKGQSVIVLAAHQFNWEWMLASGSFNLPMDLDFVYQPQNNEFFNHFSLLSRCRFGAYGIRRDEVAREMVKRKDKLRLIAIVADQYPGYKKDKKHPVKFLHQDTVFFMGASQIAHLSQYPVLYAEIHKLRRGYYQVNFVHVAEPPYTKDDHSMIDRYAHAVESTIQQHPSGWLWSHNRWKTRHLEP